MKLSISDPELSTEAYIRIILIAVVLAIVLVGLWFSSRQVAATREQFERFWIYTHERDARWDPLIERTEAHLNRQDADLKRVEDLLQSKNR